MKKFYSQNNEEQIITEFFGKNNISLKRFLDIGAYDGIRFSNTYGLVKLGWSGVCVEPCSIIFGKLKENLKDKNIQCINKAIDVKNGERLFFETDMAVSTFSREWKNNWINCGITYSNSRMVETITMETLFQNIGYDFSFINIDVEKNNYDVFNTIDFSKLPTLRVFCIEHDRYIDEIKSHLLVFGFTKLLRNGENLILGR
jgi:FkbM family methyltransferase